MNLLILFIITSYHRCHYNNNNNNPILFQLNKKNNLLIVHHLQHNLHKSTCNKMQRLKQQKTRPCIHQSVISAHKIVALSIQHRVKKELTPHTALQQQIYHRAVFIRDTVHTKSRQQQQEEVALHCPHHIQNNTPAQRFLIAMRA